MCDPLTIGSLALSAGGMVMNSMADSKVQKARKGAMTAERIRQNKLDQEAEALNAHSQDSYTDFSGQQDDKTQQLTDFFAAQNKGLPAGSDAQGVPTEVVPGSGSNIVVQEQAKQNKKTSDYTAQQAGALGNLRAFGDLVADNGRIQARDAAQIGTVGGFKRGSANVLPLELDAANSKGNSLAMFGDILSGVGSIGTAAGLSKGGYNIFGLGTGAGAKTVATKAVQVPQTALKATSFTNPFTIY